MLKLDEPMVMGKRSYDTLVFLLGQWHWGARVLETDLVPAEEQDQQIRLGSETLKGEGKHIVSAPIVAHLKLPDTLDGDPAFAAIMAKFQEAQDLLEQYVVVSGLLDNLSYELGEEVYQLRCSYMPSGKPYKMQRLAAEKAEGSGIEGAPERMPKK